MLPKKERSLSDVPLFRFRGLIYVGAFAARRKETVYTSSWS
jgi:hypothetical protein